jgi:hypothetical protein
MRQTPHFGKRTENLPSSLEATNSMNTVSSRQPKPKRASLVVWCADDDKENIPPEDLLLHKKSQSTVDSPILLSKLSGLSH